MSTVEALKKQLKNEISEYYLLEYDDVRYDAARNVLHIINEAKRAYTISLEIQLIDDAGGEDFKERINNYLGMGSGSFSINVESVKEVNNHYSMEVIFSDWIDDLVEVIQFKNITFQITKLYNYTKGKVDLVNTKYDWAILCDYLCSIEEKKDKGFVLNAKEKELLKLSGFAPINHLSYQNPKKVISLRATKQSISLLLDYLKRAPYAELEDAIIKYGKADNPVEQQKYHKRIIQLFLNRKSEELYKIMCADFVEAASDYEKNEWIDFQEYEQYTKEDRRKNRMVNNMISIGVALIFMIPTGLLFDIVEMIFSAIYAKSLAVGWSTFVSAEHWLLWVWIGIGAGIITRVWLWYVSYSRKFL